MNVYLFNYLICLFVWMKGEFEPGFITFRAINWESAAMAICSGVKPTVGCNTEHVSNQSSHICQYCVSTHGVKTLFLVLYRRRRIFQHWGAVWGLPIVWLRQTGQRARLERLQRDDRGCCVTVLPLSGFA